MHRYYHVFPPLLGLLYAAFKRDGYGPTPLRQILMIPRPWTAKVSLILTKANIEDNVQEIEDLGTRMLQKTSQSR